MPKVSACLPIYNTNPKHLREAIESILAQTMGDFELLILNDSPDNEGLKEIVAEYEDPRIVYLENEKNLGISDSRNRLIEMARGEYLAVCDHDDTWAADRFEKQAAFLDENPAVGVVGSAVRRVSDKSSRISVYPESNRLIKLRLMDSCHFSHPSAMIRRSVLIDKNVRYEPQYFPAEDYMLWCRLIEFTQFHNLPDVLLNYRLHETRTSLLHGKRAVDAAEEIRMLARNKWPELYREYRSELNVYVRLFCFIPLLKIYRDRDAVVALLFNFIPVLKIRHKTPVLLKRKLTPS
jgi:glycosyltransferase involved in cell wall biosynthesis